MDRHYIRRHSRWYEMLFWSWPFQLAVGLCFVMFLPAIVLWGSGELFFDDVRVTTLLITGASFSTVFFLFRRVYRYLIGDAVSYIAPLVTVVFLLSFAVLFFSRGAYSRPFLLLAYGLTLVWFYSDYFISKRYRTLRFAVVPVGRTLGAVNARNIELHTLRTPDLQGQRFNAVIADLHAADLTPDWERFLAHCVLSHVPVMHVRHAYETITGRIPIAHLSENEMGMLLPSPLYAVLKRMIDLVCVLILTPVLLPIMFLTAIAIRIDSPGSAVFVQSRVGQGNRDFKIYKFRSMHVNAERDGARLAQNSDSRITRVGRFIRKSRLDELPQLFNVLKGDMSLIGPRPEQRFFVDQFENEIPFYVYRHVVKPGITGWAQVMQGYADSSESTKLKIQYDFYYIKNLSLWLDVIITFKTIKTILTGFGAR